MEIKFDQKKLESPPKNAPFPFKSEAYHYQSILNDWDVYGLSINKAVPLDSRMLPCLRFDENILKDLQQRIHFSGLQQPASQDEIIFDKDACKRLSPSDECLEAQEENYNARDTVNVEKNIVVQMKPLSRRKVKIKVKHRHRAKPLIVLNPLPEN